MITPITNAIMHVITGFQPKTYAIITDTTIVNTTSTTAMLNTLIECTPSPSLPKMCLYLQNIFVSTKDKKQLP